MANPETAILRELVDALHEMRGRKYSGNALVSGILTTRVSDALRAADEALAGKPA